jgi:hypothetical protein
MKLRHTFCRGKGEDRRRVPSSSHSVGRADHLSIAALTLLEMMVSVALLAAIILGLVAMFNQTQKALHIVNSQTDVFENSRGAIRMIARDLAEMASYGVANVANLVPYDGASAGLTLPVQGPPSTNVPVQFDEVIWLARANDDWQAIGYYVAEDETSGKLGTGVGTLFRFTESVRRDQVPALMSRLTNSTYMPTNLHRISDGIVHFAFMPTYAVSSNNYVRGEVTFPLRVSTNVLMELPAYVDVEIGVIEPTTLKQYQALRDLDAARAKTFLTEHVGKIHFFRERVPIRNFVNPFRSNEVQ